MSMRHLSDYAIPANIDLGKFNEIWIWCDKFSVPLGVVALDLTKA